MVASVSPAGSLAGGDAKQLQPRPADSVDSLTDAMWSEVAAQWDALAPLDRPLLSRSVEPSSHSVSVAAAFAPEPDLRFFYHSAEHDRALNELVSSIGRSEAVVLLTAEIGAGKTTLCRALVDRVDRRTVVSFVTEAESADALLKRLLVDFGVISSDQAARQLDSTLFEDLFRTLDDFLASLAVIHASALVIVDDAHALPVEALNELRRIADLTDARRPLQLLLVGTPVLTRILRRGDLRKLDRRVVFRVEVGRLERHELHAYIAHRMAVAGLSNWIQFDNASVAEIFSASRGIPGIVNSLCDRAVRSALQAATDQIDAHTIAFAAHDVGVAGDYASRRRARVTLVVMALLMLLAGAATAGWLFRAPLSRAMAQWRGVGQSTNSTSK